MTKFSLNIEHEGMKNIVIYFSEMKRFLENFSKKQYMIIFVAQFLLFTPIIFLLGWINDRCCEFGTL